jgi:hypothetical protein
MVNVADLFQLFGEIAGLAVRGLVPASRILDSVSMLPYLTNPGQPSLRSYNFTQTGINISAHGERPPPCVIRIPPTGTPLVNTCVQVFTTEGLCHQEGGVWYGAGSPTPFTSCCALQQAMPQLGFDILPLTQAAVRNDHFKLIQVTNQNCTSNPPQDQTTVQLYRIDEAPIAPLIDFEQLNLITNQSDPTSGLGPEEKAAFLSLSQQLTAILSSEAQCPADGNYDGVVDQLDLANWDLFHKSGSSWYDFNLPSTNGYDGLTNEADRQYILQNLGTKCPPR